MAIIAEFREFYFRHIKTNSGAKADKEVGYPTQYTISGRSVFNRFLKGDVPSEGIFKKFMQSIAFKLNVEDTATSTSQGLVKAATDAEAINKTSTFSDGMTRSSSPYQLPEVEEDDTMTLGQSDEDGVSSMRVRHETYTIPSTTKTRSRYLVSLRNLYYRLPTIINFANPSVLTTLISKTIPIKFFERDGDTMIVKMFVKGGAASSDVTLDFYIGNIPISSFGLVVNQVISQELRISRKSVGVNSVVTVVQTLEQYTLTSGYIGSPLVSKLMGVFDVTLTAINLSTAITNFSVKAFIGTPGDSVELVETTVELQKM